MGTKIAVDGKFGIPSEVVKPVVTGNNYVGTMESHRRIRYAECDTRCDGPRQ